MKMSNEPTSLPVPARPPSTTTLMAVNFVTSRPSSRRGATKSTTELASNEIDIGDAEFPGHAFDIESAFDRALHAGKNRTKRRDRIGLRVGIRLDRLCGVIDQMLDNRGRAYDSRR